MLFVGFVAPHMPLVVPQEFLDPYLREDIRLPKLLPRDGYQRHPWVERMASFWDHDATFDSDARRKLAIACYYGLISFLDHQVGKVLQVLEDTGLAETEVRSLLKRVARGGEVPLVAHDHFFMTDAVQAMADIAGELAATHGAARAAEFRDRIGTGRKLAILILEFFDRVGYTRRVRDDHVLRRDNPWRGPAAAHPAVGPGLGGPGYVDRASW